MLNTVETALAGILLALVIGIVFGLMATSGKKVLAGISGAYKGWLKVKSVIIPLGKKTGN